MEQQVPQKVLNWLHSVLIGEYADVNRTFSDAAQVLKAFYSLRPSTDVYTSESGASSLLLHLTGTLPVSFRDNVYSFPISIWVPRSYPAEGPITFASPTGDMVIRPGQHVSGEGRIYHPYLAGWRSDRSSLLEFLAILQTIFSREPPLVSRGPQPRQSQQERRPEQPPPRPPLPTELRQGPERIERSTQSASSSNPPPPPPKPFQQNSGQSSHINGNPPVPPRPPLPSSHSIPRSPYTQSSSNSERFAQKPYGDFHPLERPDFQPTPHPPELQPHPPYQNPPLQNPTSSPPTGQHQGQWLPEARQPPSWQGRPPGPGNAPARWPSQNQGQPPPGQYQIPTQQGFMHPSIPQQQSKPPQEDLLSSPFDPPLPAQSSSNLPAPPIPPNPEKDALLSAISHKLTTELQSIIASNNSALQPLSAQYAAMGNAMRNMQQEHGALLSIQELLASNENILHTAMRDADACIANAQHRAVPGVDEVLVAPTVVGQQLYDLVAEEKACAESREVLGRALDRGRVSSETWVKTVRSLAREEFLKKVLIRKCAEGMGLRQEGEMS